MAIRLGAVSYLNTRPLVRGLDQDDRFTIRFDVPARCAELLHANEVDLGLIPSIEYLRGADYRIVPGLSIASDGPVASVALYTAREVLSIRSIALDTSSRTSVALTRVLCARWFEISPELVPMPPDFDRMLERCDAALVIGDNALFGEHSARGLEKIDLGEEWTGMTGLPFVYAFWAGRPGVISADHVRALQKARDAGSLATTDIARELYPDEPARAAIADRYLRENVKYDLGEREADGLRRFYELSGELGVVESVRAPLFY